MRVISPSLGVTADRSALQSAGQSPLPLPKMSMTSARLQDSEPHFRSKRANQTAESPTVPETRSVAQQEADASDRIFQQKVYGEALAERLSEWEGRRSLREFEAVILKPVWEAGLFTLSPHAPSAEGVGIVIVQMLLRAHGLGAQSYRTDAVQAALNIFKHLDTYYQEQAHNAYRKSFVISDFIARLSLSPAHLVTLADHIQRINNTHIVLNAELLHLLKRDGGINSTPVYQLLDGLAQRKAREYPYLYPYKMTRYDREALSLLLARDPVPNEARQAEIRKLIEEDIPVRRLIRHLALMGDPSRAGVDPLPAEFRGPEDCPAPYRQIWQFMNENPSGVLNPEQTAELMTHLTALVPAEYRPQTTAVYLRMQGLGLFNQSIYWMLPLIRPEFAIELADSAVLATLGENATQAPQVAYDALLSYVEMTHPGARLVDVYRWLDPVEEAPPEQQLARLSTLYRHMDAPAVDSPDALRDFLALEAIKGALEEHGGYIKTVRAAHQLRRSIPKGVEVPAVQAVDALVVNQRKAALPRDQSQLVRRLQAQIPPTGASAQTRAAALASIEALASAGNILIETPSNRLDAETLDALELAGRHAPLLARILDGASAVHYAARIAPDAVRTLLSLIPDRGVSAQEENAWIAMCKCVLDWSAAHLNPMRSWAGEKDPIKKFLQWVSIMAFPSDASGLRLPEGATFFNAPAPYKQIWEIFNQIKKARNRARPVTPPIAPSNPLAIKSNPLPLIQLAEGASRLPERVVHLLSELAPKEDQAAVRALYKKMRLLGLIDFENLSYIALPLLRPELAAELLDSLWLKTLANSHATPDGKHAAWAIFLNYVDAASAPQAHAEMDRILRVDPDLDADANEIVPANPSPARANRVRFMNRMHVKRARLALDHIRWDLAQAPVYWRRSGAHTLRHSPLQIPAVQAVWQWILQLKQNPSPLAPAMLQRITDEIHAGDAPLVTLEVVERLCAQFSVLIHSPAHRLERTDPETLAAVGQAGVHAPAFVRIVNALPPALYARMVQHEGNMFNMLQVFMRHVPISSNDDGGSSSSESTRVAAFIRAVHACVRKPTSTKQRNAWVRLMLWGPAGPGTIRAAHSMWNFFPKLIKWTLQRGNQAVRRQIHALPISAALRDRLLLLWLSTPGIQDDLSGLIEKRRADGQLELTVRALIAIIPGAHNNPADRARLAALLELSPAQLAEQLALPVESPRAVPSPRLAVIGSAIRPPSVASPAQRIASPPRQPGGSERVQPVTANLLPVIASSSAPNPSAGAISIPRARLR